MSKASYNLIFSPKLEKCNYQLLIYMLIGAASEYCRSFQHDALYYQHTRLIKNKMFVYSIDGVENFMYIKTLAL